MNVMFRLLLLCIISSVIFSCKSMRFTKMKSFSLVEVHTILSDSLLNVRALEISDGNIAIATSDGQTLIKNENDSSFVEFVKKDTFHNPNFRALALIDNNVFTLGIGNPGLLYKNGILVYKEENENVFYDSLDFWNKLEGIAVGDPVDNCISIIITRDGGDSWSKIPCDNLPKIINGEAAFAASDTNISIINDFVWIATGGMASRVLFSSDKGNSWQVYKTPIIQGSNTTGIYSIDFYNKNIGFAIGGDYTKPKSTVSNKIRTTDSGKTWNIVSENNPPGYRSCIQFVPGGKGKHLVAVGFDGIDYSSDFGESWTHLSNESFYTIRFKDKSIAYAAGKGKVALLKFK